MSRPSLYDYSRRPDTLPWAIMPVRRKRLFDQWRVVKTSDKNDHHQLSVADGWGRADRHDRAHYQSRIYQTKITAEYEYGATNTGNRSTKFGSMDEWSHSERESYTLLEGGAKPTRPEVPATPSPPPCLTAVGMTSSVIQKANPASFAAPIAPSPPLRLVIAEKPMNVIKKADAIPAVALSPLLSPYSSPKSVIQEAEISPCSMPAALISSLTARTSREDTPRTPPVPSGAKILDVKALPDYCHSIPSEPQTPGSMDPMQSVEAALLTMRKMQDLPKDEIEDLNLAKGQKEHSTSIAWASEASDASGTASLISDPMGYSPTGSGEGCPLLSLSQSPSLSQDVGCIDESQTGGELNRPIQPQGRMWVRGSQAVTSFKVQKILNHKL
ncbi:hypothetical protein TWF718_009684 [Orbilia javanica]|uniref:Uncharacterized protein n=1 Tax=Orbilia javanica TaxID=47235 RepID=A0AAN8RAP9_9PEZI